VSMHVVRTVYVCGHSGCGRVVYPSDEAKEDWLIAPRVDDPAILVTRCPQHVDERQMRNAGVPLSKANFRRVREAKERDQHTAPVPGLVIPLPMEMIAAIMASHTKTTTRTRYRKAKL
jgi:carbonic anhydrase